MVTYNRNKKGVRDDRISSIQIRWVKKKEKSKRKGRERRSRKHVPRLLCVKTPRQHSLFSVVDIRSDKGKHKNGLEIASRATIRAADEK
jgi:hypothetical protein